MNKLVYSALCLAMLAGCSSEEGNLNAGLSEDGVDVRFCSGVKTKAIIDGTVFPLNAEIGIYGIKSQKANMATTDWSTENYVLADKLDNGHYKATDATKGIQELQALDGVAKFSALDGDNAALVFYGYYPYSSQITAPAGKAAPKLAVEVPADAAQAIDYMYTEKVASAVTPAPINLVFKHAMARLDFTLQKKAAEVPDFTVTGFTVKTRNGQKGEMSIDNGQIVLASDAASARKEFTATGLSTTVNSVSATPVLDARFLLIPAGDAIEEVIFTVNRSDFSANGEYTYNVKVNMDQPVKLEKGKYTTLHITYDPKDVNFTTTIQEMETGTSNNFDAY